MGKIPLGKDLPEGISGTYCDSCKTQKQRDEMNAENKRLKEERYKERMKT